MREPRGSRKENRVKEGDTFEIVKRLELTTLEAFVDSHLVSERGRRRPYMSFSRLPGGDRR
jgi:hypothetical protein